MTSYNRARQQTSEIQEGNVQLDIGEASTIRNYITKRPADCNDHLNDEEAPNDDEAYKSSSDDESIEDADLKDMEAIQSVFPGFRQRYRLVKRIGEGTFSTVYKAEDLQYDRFVNEWDIYQEDHRWTPQKSRNDHGSSPRGAQILGSPQTRHDRPRRRPKFVAIKKIYVTSSPIRILNELDLLFELRNCAFVCPLITAFRNMDQVVAILPYFRHQDFRDYFRDMTVPDMAIYLRCLLEALAAVHAHGIIHRDIKPTNFLYDKRARHGVLVDFGLAERQGMDAKHCYCHDEPQVRKAKLRASCGAANGPQDGYPRNDTRSSRRANRAGTRGFRAPEVLFKCTEQTPKIDMWSVGVILLTIMSRRFPFFNSADDVDAMIELATIFGQNKMRFAAQIHGAVFQSNITTITNAGFDLGKIVRWCTGRDKRTDGFSAEEEVAVDFMRKLLDLDPSRRLSAEEALSHDFILLASKSESSSGRGLSCDQPSHQDCQDDVDILR